MFFYGNEWYFSLHDRQKNKGAWLKIGESFDGGIVEVIGYNEETEEVKLSGGFSLKLKSSSNMVLPVQADNRLRNYHHLTLKFLLPKGR